MKYAALILIMILCLSSTAWAHEEGYIIRADINDERLVCVSEKNIISKELGIYHVESEDELEKFQSSYRIEKYEPDCEIELFDVPDDLLYSRRWDAPLMKLPDMWDYSTGYEDVTVAVLDTGITPGHEDFDYDRIEGALNMCAFKKIIANEENINSDASKAAMADIQDDIGHGTWVSGVIASKKNNGKGVFGVASGVRLNVYKVFSSDCSDASCIVRALVDIYENRPEVDVINISIGFPTGSIVQDVIDKLAERGVIVVAAVGNYDPSKEDGSQIVYPAGCEGVIGVGAVGSNLKRATYSRYNSSVDVVAPGTHIYTTAMNNSYIAKDGTSFASPYIAALAAIAKSVDKNIDHDNFLELIKGISIDVGNNGYDEYYGWGIVQPSLMMDALADRYGFLLDNENDVVLSTEQTADKTVMTVKCRKRDYVAYAIVSAENGKLMNVQKRYISGGADECSIEFEGAVDKVYWWDTKMHPLFKR